MCEIEVVHLGPWPFVCNVIIYQQHRQLLRYSCFYVRCYCAPATYVTCAWRL